jgi:antitoxin component of MazEF toxin-antitoxin module
MEVVKVQEWTQILAPVVKIGNSFSVRIPMNIIKQLSIKEGEGMYVRVKKYDRTLSPEVIDFWFKVARRCRDLKAFSDEKIILMSRLAFNEGLKGLEACNYNDSNGDLNSIQLKKLEGFRKEYRLDVKHEYGAKIHREYSKFRKVIELAMQNLEKPD